MKIDTYFSDIWSGSTYLFLGNIFFILYYLPLDLSYYICNLVWDINMFLSFQKYIYTRNMYYFIFLN